VIGYGAVSMRGPLALMVLLGVALLAAGCGEGTPERPSQPRGTPRAAVLAFYDDVEAGRFAAACARLDPAQAKLMQVLAQGNLRIPAGTHAERRSYIRRTNAAITDCVTGLRRFAGDYPRRVRGAREVMRSARQTKPFPIPLWEFRQGESDASVRWQDGHWVVLSVSL